MKPEAKILSIIGLVTLIALAVGVFFLSKGPSSSASTSQPVDPQLLIRSDSSQTSPNAKVTLVEFGDYQCPACGQAYSVIKQVEATYGDKVNLVFRNFPLPQHKNALISAEAAEAAGAQGKYWDMYDALYQHQADWSGSSDPMSIFKTYAQNMGLDVSKFKSDVESNKFADKISGDQKDGEALGVNATPTFYLNNRLFFVGIPSYDGLKNQIDPALNN